MEISDGKIIRCTMRELYWYYVDGDWDELYAFGQFIDAMERSGVTITEDGYAYNRSKGRTDN